MFLQVIEGGYRFMISAYPFSILAKETLIGAAIRPRHITLLQC